MVGVTLINCGPEEVKFLSDVLEDVKGLLEDAGPQSTQMTEMNTVINLLNKTLENHRRDTEDAVACEPPNPFRSGNDVGDLNHNRDGLEGEQWELEKLCKWILLQANGLQENEKCRGIIAKLEARCGLASSKPAKGIETTEGIHDPRYIFILPDELLQHIFRLAILPHFWVQGPLVLSHVNADFRSIVLNTPTLWTTIDEGLSPHMRNLYVARSKDVPLDVRPRLDHDPDPSESGDDWPELMGLECSRIGRMIIAGKQTRLLLKALDGARGLLSLTIEDLFLDLEEHYPPLAGRVILPLLESLEFANVPVTDMDSIALNVSTPNLSSSWIASSGPPSRIADFLIPFTADRPQISSLQVLGYNLELQELKVVLHNLVNLTHLHIRTFSLTENDLTSLKNGNLLPRFTRISS
ncbi:hypothetical protein FRC01_004569 [Tulasnella sp. 417]|nr:hypothetical protein FRC01_004569 [Tulasnella sp. 417]